MAVLMDEDQAPEAVAETDSRPRGTRRRYIGRTAKWLAGILAAIIVLIAAAAVVLNTPVGERFLADRIAARTLPNGLNIRIGRIEGDLYGRARLYDVVLSDPTGPFMTIPEAELDWNPGAWLRNTLDIDEFAARRATLTRLPEFLPSEEDGPILPGFDIAIDRLAIERLTLAEGIAGDRAETLDLVAEVQLRDRRLKVDTRGALQSGDRFAALIDAAPDRDRFDLGLTYVAPEGGAIARIVGAQAPYTARIAGDGSWSRWDGSLLVRRGEDRFAAFRITNRSGRFGLLGQAEPGPALDGLLADMLRGTVSLRAEATIEDRRIEGDYVISASAFAARAEGLVDLAENRVGDVVVSARLRDPGLFGGLRLEDATLDATVDGPLRDLAVDHTLEIGEVTSGGTRITDLRQQGMARYDGARWTFPLDARLGRVATGNDLLDPRLVTGTLRGTALLNGARLTAENLALRFPTTSADVALQGDLGRGLFGIAGDVRAQQVAFDDIGRASGAARIRATIAPGTWQVRADLDARVAPVTNATLANLVGEPIRLRGGVGFGAGVPLRFDDLNVAASKVTARLDGTIADGVTTLAGTGRHVDYGPFTVEGRIAPGGPEAVLVFADPLPAAGLSDVRLAIAPSENGFRIETQGGSTLGPFDGVLTLVAPGDGATRIAIERLTLSDTAIRGDLTLAEAGIAGDLALSGGGLDGTIALAPRGGGQGFDLDLEARNAVFGGATPITIARATINARGLLAEGNSTISGTARGAGLSYGTLFIGRFAAQGEVTNGRGTVDASIAGRRSGSFAMDLKAGIAPEQVTLAARGEFAGRRITMPRRAVLTRLDDGGWRLDRTLVKFGGGGVLASGRFGGGETTFDLALSKMPLSLGDIVVPDLGLGGTISGRVEFALGPDRLPRGQARVKVDDLLRSGLVLSSRPVDLALVANLTAERLEARAVVENQDIRRGRMQAIITGLPQTGTLDQRLRNGALRAQLRYQGAAESLWRLAAIDAFDLTGPVAIAADASGTLANPRVRGSLRSDALRLRSSLSGTDIRDMAVRGTFAGSRLRLSRFAGTTPNGGSVTGSGTVDLEGLGERVQGRFLEARGPKLDLKAAATNAKLLAANGIEATVTGPLRIVSDGFGGTIAGRVRINRASWRLATAAEDVRLPRIATREINRPADIGQRVAPGRPWRYLIDARGTNRIDVEGMGLDSEWGADIRIRGTTDDPRIGGEARVVRGDYTFAGTRFELSRGAIEFDVTRPIDPSLDIRAETERDGIEVEVRVTGSSEEPEITFSSNPALPEEEILARLLFGGSITNLSATDALQLGAAVASLRGGGGMDPINQLRSAIGLDRLRIVSADPALDRGTGIALGKNFGRRFYVEIITDGRGYSATEVEFRITSWLALLASVSTIGRESVVAEISRDY